MPLLYQEAIFTVPYSNNRNDTHQLVQHAVTMGDELAERNYIYDCHPIAGQTAITIRGEKLPAHLTPAKKEIAFAKGDIREFTISLNPTKFDRSTNKTIIERDSVKFAIEKLERSGWTNIKATEIKSESFIIHKEDKGGVKRGLIVNEMKILAEVAEPEQVYHHFIKGVGRAKAYGCGLMYAGKLHD